MTVVRTLVSGNFSRSSGGGISSVAVLTIANSTISGNAINIDYGAGLALFSPAQLTHVTIVGNDGREAIYYQTEVKPVLTHSIVIGEPPLPGGVFGVTCNQPVTDNGYNIDAGTGCAFSDPTSQSNVDPMVGPLADNGGQSFTHALLAGSPALNAIPVGTNGCGTAGETDQRGVGFARLSGAACDIGAYEDQVAATTTTVLSISPSTQQYSDKVSLTASVLPASATGSVQFRKSIDDGATFADLGSPVSVVNGSAAFNDHQILQAAGTAVKFKAVFTATGNFANSEDTANLTVTRENATIGYGAGNVAALQVSAAGGSLNANALTLSLTVKETEPDLAAATKGVGTIANAGLKVVLAPVAGGTGVELTCTASAVTGTGYAATRPYTCKNATTLPVNTYEVVATVTGDYYTGTYSDAFTVFDPSLGFATGGGSFVLGGDKVNFGFTMKYNKGGTSLQGNLIAVRHHPDGTVSRLKSNALAGLALGEDASVPMGWTSFTGKANYTKWDATAGAYVTVGNQSFSVYAEDRDNPGTGVDRIWLGAPGTLAMPGTLATAKANTAVLTGGGIAVPHKAAAGGGGKK